MLAAHWLRDQVVTLPQGIVCEGVDRAAEAALWFLRRGKSCIVKADKGEGSLGHHVIHPGEPISAKDIARDLRTAGAQ